MADVNIKINLITRQAEAQLKRLNSSVAKFGNTAQKSADRGVKNLNAQFGRTTDIIKGIIGANLFFVLGRQILNFTTGAVRNFASFEEALIGVAKTTNATDKELEQIEVGLRDLAETIPVARDELARIAELAGQLGIRGTRDLLKFTDTVARLTRTTNLGAEDASIQLARLLNLTRESTQNIDRLGSSIVDVGNNFATTESEIVSLATRIGQATTQYQVTTSDLIGLSGALKSLGAQSESAGTSIGRVFAAIDLSIANGGKRLETFANLTGLSVDEFTKRFREDATSVLVDFIEGLSDLQKSGGNAVQALNQLGLSNVRVRAAILPLVNNVELLNRALETSRTAQQENTALAIESERAFGSLQAQFDLTINQIQDFTDRLVTLLSPALRTILRLTGESSAAFSRLFQSIGAGSELEEQIAGVETQIISLEKELRSLQNTGVSSISNFGAAVGNLVNNGQRIKQVELLLGGLRAQLGRLKDEQEEIESRGRPGGDADPGGDNGESAKNDRIKTALERRQELVAIFRNADNEARRLQLEEEALEAELFQNERFQFLQDNLGKEAALRIARRVQEIQAEATTNEKRLAAAKRINQLLQQEEEKASKAKIQLDQRTSQARLGVFQGFANLAGAIAKDGSKEQFLIQKASALAGAIVAKNLAEAQALAVPPAPNFALAGLAKAAGNLNIAAIVASAVKGFQDGGVVGGNSFSGDSVLARVNSGEMILNRQQQANLFQLAQNSPERQEGQEVPLQNTVIIEVDGEVLTKAVSRSVANGADLGDFGV